MLLRFSVRNYRSIAETQELNLTATSLKGHEDFVIESGRTNVLPSVVIYGANASGKSNLLRSFQFFRHSILRSHTRKSKKPITSHFFKLGEIQDGDSATFECDFVIRKLTVGNTTLENVRYTYGYKLSQSEILEEWLYAFPKGYRQVWFHRNKAESKEFFFGKELKGKNTLISENTRPDALFLSTASTINHEQLRQIYEYFDTNFVLRLDPLDNLEDESTILFLENEELRSRILDYLKIADVGVCSADIKTRKTPEDITKILGEVHQVFSKHFPEQSPELEINKKKVNLGHAGKSGIVYFDLEDESRGTLAYLNLIGWVIIALETGLILIVDEFDSSLHPLLCRKVIELFSNKQYNTKGAQLVFTTHDTSLLNLDLFRRDQIWLSEKSEYGETKIFPLSDLDIRKDDNIQKGYLQGRFGAIPFLGNISDLIDTNNT